MRKYLGVFGTSFKQEKDATWNTLIGSVGYIILIFVFVQLWCYIYGANGTGSIINGFTLQQMLWYLVITECIYFGARAKSITSAISNEIKSGSIAYKLNKPYNYYLYCVSQFMAKSVFTIIIMLPVSFIVGLVLVGIPDTFCFEQIIPCIFTILMSLLLTWTFYGIIGLIAFWTQESTPYYWVVSKFFMIFGLLLPITFFPAWLQPIIMYSPVYALFSGPASLVANFSWELFGQVVLSQAIWISIIIALGLWIYKLGKKKVTSNGG